MRPYEISFRIFFQEEYENFRVKMFHNVNQLQWKLESKNLHSSNPKTYLDVLRTPFKKFFYSKEVHALKFHNKSRQKNFKDYTSYEPKTYRRNILWYLDVLDKLIDKRVLKNVKLRMKEREVQAIKEIEKRLKERNDPDADIGPSYNSNTVSEVHHDLFKNMFVHGIQNHDLPESIPDTYVVNENNSNIMSDIPNMDPDREKAEHDYVDEEQQHAYSAS
ncbi:hypothetical protein Tco_1376544 [Tanacetum coccineum]